MRECKTQLLDLDPLTVLLVLSHTDSKPGLTGANYVGEKLSFSMSNAQLLGRQLRANVSTLPPVQEKAQFHFNDKTTATYPTLRLKVRGGKVEYKKSEAENSFSAAPQVTRVLRMILRKWQSHWRQMLWNRMVFLSLNVFSIPEFTFSAVSKSARR